MAALKKLFTRSDKKSKSSGSEQISEIGAPFGISHNIHVGFDNDAGTFVGLPPAWQEWLKKSNITWVEAQFKPRLVLGSVGGGVCRPVADCLGDCHGDCLTERGL